MRNFFSNPWGVAVGAVMLAASVTACAHQEVYVDEKSAVVGFDIAPCEPAFDGYEADCGALNVYENRKTKTGRIIPIKFVRVRARNGNETDDAVFVLTGGPGEGATPNASVRMQIEPTMATRDLVIVDQRGTGGSNPLDCLKYDLAGRPEAFKEMFERPFFDPENYKKCKDRLSEKADLTQYTTSIIADDINDLREALGYKKMTLSGGSYGTTLGLEIIRRHENHVRAAVFKGVVPPSVFQTETLAADADMALEGVIAACENDASCNEAFPSFRQDMAEVLDDVAKEPVKVTLPHSLTQEPTQVRVKYGELATAIRYVLYSAQVSAGLPLAVSEAKAGDYTKLTQFLPTLLYQLSEIGTEGMWASVRCAEEFPYIDVSRTRALSENTMLGTARLDSGLAICSFWPRGERAENFADPVRADTPVLMLTGEYDAASPPWMGEEAVRHLPNARLVVVPNSSHWDLGNPCVNQMVIEFVDTADVNAIDASCAADAKRPPFTLPQ
ncbi:alpha/beta hydrolase [Hyphococcus flavus]|uniref:Proline iminopeptidase n=1 Tax=Hyphococcus flavus TaxID=1866326 RepID=A0AAE9ZJJ4_9PROT|nr:alpha/beta hydrolase [Hyphococcus flavus]WDI32271.1 alpha/beta hydrolase [Hyphococcus flavus]